MNKPNNIQNKIQNFDNILFYQKGFDCLLQYLQTQEKSTKQILLYDYQVRVINQLENN